MVNVCKSRTRNSTAEGADKIAEAFQILWSSSKCERRLKHPALCGVFAMAASLPRDNENQPQREVQKHSPAGGFD